MGLNSALFAGYDGDDEQKLALGLYQVDPALGQMAADAPLSIGFFHHPFDCYHPADKVCENRLRNKLDIILTGHLHDPQNATDQTSAGQCTVIGAGAAYETRESKNSFNWADIDLSNGKGQVHFFKYVPDHHTWNRDVDVNPHHSDGLFEFTVPGIQKAPLTKSSQALQPVATVENKPTESTPPVEPSEPTQDKPSLPQCHFIHDYLLPEGFVGRGEERQRLHTLLQGGPVNATQNPLIFAEY